MREAPTLLHKSKQWGLVSHFRCKKSVKLNCGSREEIRCKTLREKKRSFLHLVDSSSWGEIKEKRKEKESTAQRAGSRKSYLKGHFFMAFADSPERLFSLPKILTQTSKGMVKEGKKEGVMNK